MISSSTLMHVIMIIVVGETTLSSLVAYIITFLFRWIILVKIVSIWGDHLQKNITSLVGVNSDKNVQLVYFVAA